jgi:hypothetical protein
MLSITKNQLLNLILRLELALNDARSGHYNNPPETNNSLQIIDRNIQSIKKTIKRI